MTGTKACSTCEAQRWTCSLWADLQVATHIIRRSQPHMLSLLGSSLADARTLAHRIVYQDCNYSIKIGATRAILPNHGRIRGDGPALEQLQSYLPMVYPRGADHDQASGSLGRTVPTGAAVDQGRIPSTPTSSVLPTNKDCRGATISNPCN